MTKKELIKKLNLKVYYDPEDNKFYLIDNIGMGYTRNYCDVGGYEDEFTGNPYYDCFFLFDSLEGFEYMGKF